MAHRFSKGFLVTAAAALVLALVVWLGMGMGVGPITSASWLAAAAAPTLTAGPRREYTVLPMSRVARPVCPGWTPPAPIKDEDAPTVRPYSEPAEGDGGPVLQLTMWNSFWGLYWEGQLGPYGDWPVAEYVFPQPGESSNLGPFKGPWLCPKRCNLSHDRAVVERNESRAIIMHTPTLAYDDLPGAAGRGRGKHAPWVMLSLECPHNDNVYSDNRDIELVPLFDYSMTYRRDADFPFTYAPRDLLRIATRPPLVPLANKTADVPVVWTSSRCDPPNNRQVFVEELMQHFPVHSLGSCLNNHRWPAELPARALVDAIARYKFYLAVENSNCADYITELLFNALRAGVVPIVNGPRENYKAYLPVADGAIFLDEYGSLNELVAHLDYLSNNDTAYLHLLRYREGIFGGPAAPPAVPLSNAFLATVRQKERQYSPFCALCIEAHVVDRHLRNTHEQREFVPAGEDARKFHKSPIHVKHGVRPDRSCFPKDGHPFAHLERWQEDCLFKNN